MRKERQQMRIRQCHFSLALILMFCRCSLFSSQAWFTVHSFTVWPTLSQACVKTLQDKCFFFLLSLPFQAHSFVTSQRAAPSDKLAWQHSPHHAGWCQLFVGTKIMKKKSAINCHLLLMLLLFSLSRPSLRPQLWSASHWFHFCSPSRSNWSDAIVQSWDAQCFPSPSGYQSDSISPLSAALWSAHLRCPLRSASVHPSYTTFALCLPPADLSRCAAAPSCLLCPLISSESCYLPYCAVTGRKIGCMFVLKCIWQPVNATFPPSSPWISRFSFRKLNT